MFNSVILQMKADGISKELLTSTLGGFIRCLCCDVLCPFHLFVLLGLKKAQRWQAAGNFGVVILLKVACRES